MKAARYRTSSITNERNRPVVPASMATSLDRWGPLTDEDRAEMEEDNELWFVDKVTGGRIPKNFIPAIEKGFRKMMDKGPVAGYPVVGIKIVLDDGSFHDVDSSDMAFMLTAQECFRENYNRMKPSLLEPIMLMEVECPRRIPRFGRRADSE